MTQKFLHAIDLATAGNLEGAHRALEGREEPIATRLGHLFSELGDERRRQLEIQSLIRHEMGNSLSIVQANLEGIMDGVLEPTAVRYSGMRDALEAVARLLDDWRRPSARIEQKIQTVRLDDINICAIIGAQAALIDGLASAKNVSVSYQACGLHHPECTHYRGDAQRIGQVIRNVLINAVRYTPPGGRVEIHCDRPNAEVTLVINDSGPGIGAQDLPRIFESGYRAGRTSRSEGSGLGLSVVSLILRAIGGRARVLSEEGSGATFVITLPAAPAASAPDLHEGFSALSRVCGTLGS